MPIAVVATVAIQILCVVHAVRTGRTQPWLYVIVFLPLAGSVAYFLVEVLPGMADTRRARRVFTDVTTLVDPDREFRERKADVEMSGTPAAKAALADECARKGMFDEAVVLYRSSLSGLYADDPTLLLGFARVLIEKGDFAECEQVLDHMRDKNKDVQSPEGHLIYARALEGQNKIDATTQEYENLIGYFAGFEAKVRYALFLQKLGNVGKAREVLEGVVNAYKRQPRHAQALNRDWYDVARRNLGGG
jgi:hypothetical protein